MKRFKHAIISGLCRFRATLIIVLVLATITIAIMVWLRFLPGAHFIEQDRLDAMAKLPRPVDTSSPVYQYAVDLAWTWAIVQCDGVPSVRVGKLAGYRILLQHEWKERETHNNEARVRWKRTHKDIVLVPSNTAIQPKLRHISFENVEQHEPVVSVYMGQGHGYHWFGRMTIPQQDSIREKMGLNGGNDRLNLFVKHLNRFENEKGRKNALDLLAIRMGEQALPVLMNEIEHNYYGCRWHAIRALGHVPGKESTNILLSLYKNEETVDAAKHALLSYPYREEAKQVYLDILTLEKSNNSNYLWAAVQASVEFGWKESIPLLEKRVARHYNINWYIKCCNAIRTLNNNPMPTELAESEDTILKTGWKHINPEDVEHARKCIESHDDIHGALLVSLALATVWGKMNFRYPNEVGVNLLRGLPRDKVLDVLEHLAANIRDSNSRERAVELLETVRSSPVPTS